MADWTYSLTLCVRVFDEKALREAAARKAEEHNLGYDYWMNKEPSVSDDLVMLLDPGMSPDGCEILDSRVD